MKTLMLINVFLLVTLSAAAQVAEGNKFVNGTLNITLLGNDGNTRTAVTVNPRAGYFISDRTAVGGALGIISQSGSGFDNNLTVSLSPFVRRFFPIADDKFYFFVDGTFSLSYGNSAAGFGEFTSSNDAFSVGLEVSPGFIYFPAERWSLDFSLTGFGLILLWYRRRCDHAVQFRSDYLFTQLGL